MENAKVYSHKLLPSDRAPAGVWRTLRADTPVPVEIYLDADTDWTKFDDLDLRNALFLEVSAWWSEQNG